MKQYLRIVLGGLLAIGFVACASDIRRFPLADPLWEDPDRGHVPERPGEYYSGLLSDGADMMVFYPVANALALPLLGESVNVNALDEVPNSAWFQNRIGFYDYTPEEAAKGPCLNEAPLDPEAHAPWTVTKAKPNGANPGFFIKAADGRRYLLKFDGPQQPPRPTGSDVLGSKLYWLMGFHAPCNSVVYFPENIFKIAEDAEAENELGEDVPITEADIDKVLGKAMRLKNGLLRASASQFVPGRPIGPFKYEGTRSDDPNDVIDHRNRRELRGSRLFAAWINHFDSREQNSLDVWVKDGEKEYIRHYFIDWGDSLGGRWPFDQVSRRLGRSYYFDWEQFTIDLITLGLYPRDWNSLALNDFETFGYFDGESFVPSEWKAGYLNPAHARMTPNDALWAVRIISRITPAHLRAIVEEAKFPDPRQENFLMLRLLERRQRIFEEYLTQYVPLTNFTLARRTEGSLRQSLCWEDLALKHQLVKKEDTHYKLRFRGGEALNTELGWMEFQPDAEHPHRSCVVVPIGHRRPAKLAPERAPNDHPLRYGVMDIFVHQTKSIRPTSSIQIHFYDLGPEQGYRIVGIVRPPETKIPEAY